MKPSFKSFSIASFILVMVYFVEIFVWAWLNPPANISRDVFLPLVLLTKIAAHLYMMCIPLFWMAMSIYRQIRRIKESIFVMRMSELIRVRGRKYALFASVEAHSLSHLNRQRGGKRCFYGNFSKSR